MTLKLVVENTDDDIRNEKLGKQPLFLICRRCKHRWKTTIAETSDKPECPRCHG